MNFMGRLSPSGDKFSLAPKLRQGRVSIPYPLSNANHGSYFAGYDQNRGGISDTP